MKFDLLTPTQLNVSDQFCSANQLFYKKLKCNNTVDFECELHQTNYVDKDR